MTYSRQDRENMYYITIGLANAYLKGLGLTSKDEVTMFFNLSGERDKFLKHCMKLAEKIYMEDRIIDLNPAMKM